MQEFVHSVFVTVVSVVVTLLTVGLTGIITLLVTDRDTPHADTPIRAGVTSEHATAPVAALSKAA